MKKYVILFVLIGLCPTMNAIEIIENKTFPAKEEELLLIDFLNEKAEDLSLPKKEVFELIKKLVDNNINGLHPWRYFKNLIKQSDILLGGGAIITLIIYFCVATAAKRLCFYKEVNIF